MEEQVTNRPAPFDFDSALDRFEATWQSGSPGEIAEFLPADTDESFDRARRRELLAELVMIDLWHRWRQAGLPGGAGREAADGGGADASTVPVSLP